MAIQASIHDTDPVAAFLASKPELHLSIDVYAAEKAFTHAVERPSCPTLDYSWTKDQLDPDPREAVVEAILGEASDRDDISLAVALVAALRRDLDRHDVLDGIHRLYEMAAEVTRSALAGRWRDEQVWAERYADELSLLAHTPVTS